MNKTVITIVQPGITEGTFRGGEQAQKIPPGTFLATKKGSASKTGKFTEAIRCRGHSCSKVFYTEYVNGFSWECPYCGTVH